VGDVMQVPAMLSPNGRRLERWKVQSQASLVIRRVNGHPHSLRRSEIRWPWQRHELAVVLH